MITYASACDTSPIEWDFATSNTAVYHNYNINYDEEQKLYIYIVDQYTWPEYYEYTRKTNEEKITELQLAAAEMYESLQE